MKPLNGERTHPLTPAALRVLADLCRAPIPRQEINPGIVDRLEREDLATVEDLPSPYRTRPGKVRHLVVTAAGRAAYQKHK